MSEEIKKMFHRIELDKANDSCGFEFADGFSCTFDNIATCYDDRLKLYELVKQLQQENKQLKTDLKEANDNATWWNNRFNAVSKENQQLKEDILFCLKSIKQEMEMSIDSRTRKEMKTCYEILDKASNGTSNE